MTTPVNAAQRVGARIKRRLEELGMTSRAFGRALGHKDAWVSNLLSGKFALSLNELDQVARVLRLPAGELVRESEEGWDLAPTEMRIVRALRLLPVSVREHMMYLADYLVGVVPDEIDMIKKIRALDGKELEKLQHWVDVTLLRLHPEPAPAATLDLGPTLTRPDGPTPRTGTRSKR